MNIPENSIPVRQTKMKNVVNEGVAVLQMFVSDMIVYTFAAMFPNMYVLVVDTKVCCQLIVNCQLHSFDLSCPRILIYSQAK